MTLQICQANTAIFDQLMEHLDGLGNVPAPDPKGDPISGTATSAPVSASIPAIGMISSSDTSTVPYIAPSPSNVLSRWLWVDRIIIESIGNGEFNINYLSKLHCE